MLSYLILCSLSAENGFYPYYFDGKLYTLYTYFRSNGDRWVRLNYKTGTTISGTSNSFEFDSGSTKELIRIIKAIGWSDSMTTIEREKSWVLDDVQFSSLYLSIDNLSSYHSNIFNGKTPTGTVWTSGYNGGYVLWGGVLRTFGSWSQMFYGCGDYCQTGNTIWLRGGGDSGPWKGHNDGEYLHHKCNDYTENTNSITSMVSWSNTRVCWAKIEYKPYTKGISPSFKYSILTLILMLHE